MTVFSSRGRQVKGLMSPALAAMIAIALLLLSASCGGSSIGLQDDLGDNLATNGPIVVANGELPAIPQDGNGIPNRSASAVETIPGSSAVVVSNGEVVDTTIVLTSLNGSAPADGGLAYALYQVSGLAGKRITSLSASVFPGQLGQSYSVGVSNFSEGVWDFLQTTTLPEFEYDLSAEESRMVSRLGNLYFIVVVSDGASATVVEASVISEDDPTGGTGTPPAMGGRPQASEGLSDRIVVTWNAIDGAESYELWRAEDTDGIDETFALIAEQAELSYTDMAIELSTEYHYKVRGVNSAGTGLFGSKDSGWAGTVPPTGEGEENGEKSIHGTIEAISETSITVNGNVFAIGENTRFENENGLPAEPALFTVGTFVEVHGRTDGADGWNATRIKLDHQHMGQEREVYGAIESISEFEIVVNGESFILNASTEWLDDNNNPIDRSLFVVDTLVEVDSYSDGAGGWLVEKVKFDDGEGGTGISETGNIEAKDGTTITVNGVVFDYNESTEWLDNDNNPLTPDDFSVGMLVKVEADPNGESGWLAYKVKMEDGVGGGTQELGNIQAIDATTITVNDVVFDLNESTEWLDGDNNPASPESFTVGLLVKVEADPNGSGGWLAYKVKMED